MTLPVERIGGFRRRLRVCDVVKGVLLARGEETMAELFRAYKEQLRDAYHEEWEDYKKHRRYQIIDGRRVYLRHPPEGMKYLSFARYINCYVALGLIEPVAVDATRKTAPKEERLVSEELWDVLPDPVYYRLTPKGEALDLDAPEWRNPKLLCR